MIELDLDFVGYRGAAVHPYPATMPYPVAESLLLRHSAVADVVFDPFAGSGTTLRAAAANGRPSIGSDLNPLACLIARTAVNALNPSYSVEEIDRARQSVWDMLSRRNEPLTPAGAELQRIERWFDGQTIEQLGRIAHALACSELSGNAKDLLLVAFSRTVRQCSLSRPGELKLWKRHGDFVAPDALATFFDEALDLMAMSVALRAQNRLEDWAPPTVIHGDAKDVAASLSDVSLILTSPPYGDAWTTVAYGNFTMLSRLWLGVIDSSYTDSDPAREDELLPGGRLRALVAPDVGALAKSSPTFAMAYSLVSEQSAERAQTLAAFFADLFDVYGCIARTLATGGRLVNVVGPRRVSGVVVDTGAIISELLEAVSLAHVQRLTRRVSGKRLPSRTRQRPDHVDDTINFETIDVMRVH